MVVDNSLTPSTNATTCPHTTSVCVYVCILIVSQELMPNANCRNCHTFFSELNIFLNTLIINHLTQAVQIYHQKLEDKNNSL